MQNQIPNDLWEAINTTIIIAVGYLLRLIQVLLTKKSSNNENKFK